MNETISIGKKKTKTIAPRHIQKEFSVGLKKETEMAFSAGRSGNWIIFGIVFLLILGIWGAVILNKIDWNAIILRLTH